jgi:hypothetical protein
MTSINSEKTNEHLLSPKSEASNRIKDFREQYYSTIKKNVQDNSQTFLARPKFSFNPNLLYIEPFDAPHEIEDKDLKKVPSYVTIISLWSCMIGSSLVSIQWAVFEAGIIPTICIYFYLKISYLYAVWICVSLYCYHCGENSRWRY